MDLLLKTFFLTFIFSIVIFAGTPKKFDPEKVYTKNCALCHGKTGKHPAFGRSDIIAEQSIEDLVESMNFFKNSKFDSRDVSKVMAKQVKNLSSEEIKKLAEYISKLGEKK